MQHKQPDIPNPESLQGLTDIEKNVLNDYFVSANSLTEISRLHSIPIGRARKIIMKFLYTSKRRTSDLELIKADEILYSGTRHKSYLKKK